MCGISGIVSFGSSPERDLADLAVMHASLRHRGPDGEGTLLVDRSMRAELHATVPPAGSPAAAFAFRRLRIRDVDPRADQPMRRAGRAHWVLFNGEIYNDRELRDELGGEFHTHSDTEVLLAAYDRWGSECFAHLRGMWAIVIVDLERGVLVGSRDRMGIRPLAYSIEADRLLIASEPQAIAAVRNGGPTMNAGRFRQFLAGYPQPSPNVTFFDGIEQVPFGTTFEVPLDGRRITSLAPRTYWDLRPFTSDDLALGTSEAFSMFEALLPASVREHAVSDVPVGSLLSGGLDSSTIARLWSGELARSGLPPLKTFSIVYDDEEMDESPWMKPVVAMGGLDATFVRFTPDEAFSLADAEVAAQGEPVLGWELLAQYRVFQAAREAGIVVMLCGQGSDEIFGGYPFFEPVLVNDRLRHFELFQFAAEVRALAKKYDISVARMAWQTVAGPIRLRRARSSGGRTYRWMPDGPPLPPWDDSLFDGGESHRGLNRLLYAQTRVNNLPGSLLYEDRNGMAHSLEARVPFLDHRIVELAFRLPQEWKIHRGNRKRILRKFSESLLPPKVIGRRDKRALVSTRTWIDLRAHAQTFEEMLADTATFDAAGFHVDEVRQFVRDFLGRQHNDILAVWRIYTAWLWLRRFRPVAPRSAA